MCLSAWISSPGHRFAWVVAANRDEFFDRAALPMDWWTPQGGHVPVLAGRDLSAGGTWQGLNAQGRLVWLTNVREPGRTVAGAPSRGELVTAALQTGDIDLAWMQAQCAPARNGFNLLVADLRTQGALWVSNREAAARVLGAGANGLSNAALNTPWPKLVALRQRLQQALHDSDGQRDRVAGRHQLVAQAFAALADRQVPDDASLPRTGVPLDRERQLAPAFIHIPGATPGTAAYGTRCSTVIVVEQCDRARQVHVVERRFDDQGRRAGDSHHRLTLPDAPG